MTRIVVLEPAAVIYDAAGDRLMLGNENLQQIYIKDQALAYRDVQAIIKHGHDAGGSAITANDRVGVSVRRKSQIDKLIGYVTGTQMVIQSMVDGFRTTLASASLGAALARSTNYWLRLTVKTNTGVSPARIEMTLEHFLGDPLGAPPPSAAQTLSHNILNDGATAALYAEFAMANGEPGIFWHQADSWQTAWVDDFTVVPSALTDTLVATVVNYGNFRTQPLIRIQGGITDPVLTNLANDEVLKLVGTIAEGSFIDLDIERRTITDNTGDNRFDLLDMTSDWMELEPGENPIEMDAAAITGSPSLTVFYRDAWM